MNKIYRYETKFCCSLNDLGSIYSWIYSSPFFIKKQHPNRSVNNIYFDWFDLKDAGDNLIGLGRREKLRLRWYGDTKASTSMQLEKKIRRDALGTKEITQLNEFSLEHLSKTALCQQILDNDIKRDDSLIHLKLRNPVIRNRYLREYYCESENRIRLTIDKNIAFYSVQKTSDVLYSNKVGYPLIVIELKYSHDDLARVKKMMNNFPLRPSRHSKYLAGIARMIEQPYF